jgi:hypothetical protein
MAAEDTPAAAALFYKDARHLLPRPRDHKQLFHVMKQFYDKKLKQPRRFLYRLVLMNFGPVRHPTKPFE